MRARFFTALTVAIADSIATGPGSRQPHIVINALAWCAAVFTKTLNDQLVNSPNRGSISPPVGLLRLLLIPTLKQGAMQ